MENDGEAHVDCDKHISRFVSYLKRDLEILNCKYSVVFCVEGHRFLHPVSVHDMVSEAYDCVTFFTFDRELSDDVSTNTSAYYYPRSICDSHPRIPICFIYDDKVYNGKKCLGLATKENVQETLGKETEFHYANSVVCVHFKEPKKPFFIWDKPNFYTPKYIT